MDAPGVAFAVVPRYTALIGIDDGPDRYQELTEPIEAADPRAAAQLIIDRGVIHPDDQFPQILVIEEAQVAIFTRNDRGRAATAEEDFARLLAHGPATATIFDQPPDRAELAASGDPALHRSDVSARHRSAAGQ